MNKIIVNTVKNIAPPKLVINFAIGVAKSDIKNVDINFIDHIIIGNDEPFSLRMCFMQDEW